MRGKRPSLCLVATTPLVIHFFLRAHVFELARHFEVTLVFNKYLDTYLPPHGLPAQEVHVAIERKIAPWSDLLALFGILRQLVKRRYDLVVSVVPKAGLLGMIAAFIARTPTRIHIFQGEAWASRRGWMRRLLKFMDSLTARLATHVIAVSRSEREFLEREGVVPRGRITVLGEGSICGVDIGRFSFDSGLRNSMRKELDVPENAVLCIFVGRLTADKGVLDLARAFAISANPRPGFWLLIVGPDEECIGQRVRTLIPEELAGRVLLRGFTATPERYLAAADFLCLPSYREGFGMVILEAAAAGITAVATRVYGITDAIQDKITGDLVPAADPEALAVAMGRMVDDPQRRNKLSSAACHRARVEFEQKLVVGRYVEYCIQAARNS
jgi:glycosyltransferase involved in cell wall biosynthesis